MPSASVPLAAVLGVGACIVVGGLFAACDAAVTSLPEARLRALVENAPKGSVEELQRVRESPTTVLARFLVGRSVCLVLAAVILTRSLMPIWPTWGTTLAAALVVVLYTTVAEVATSLARGRSTEVTGALLRIVRPFELAIVPLAAPLAALGNFVTALDRRHRTESDPAESGRIAEAEVEFLIEKGQKDGVLSHGDLLQKAVEFKDVVVSSVMVPRTKMVALEIGTPLLRVLEMISAEGHSRMPVYAGKIDEIVGLLYVKDLFRFDREGKLASTSLEALVRRPVLFVQENQEVDEILKEMRSQRLHMAIVVDEFGGTSGLVTLEDILELLVGEIRDELDDDEPMQELGNGRLLVDASVSVEEVAARIGVQLPQHDGFVSIGGLVMEQLGKVPTTGTVIQIGAVDFVVRDADERRVRRIEVVPNAPRPPPG